MSLQHDQVHFEMFEIHLELTVRIVRVGELQQLLQGRQYIRAITLTPVQQGFICTRHRAQYAVIPFATLMFAVVPPTDRTDSTRWWVSLFVLC